MQYRVYSGPKGSGEVTGLAKEQMLFMDRRAIADALRVGEREQVGGASHSGWRFA